MLGATETGGRQEYEAPGRELDFLNAVLDTVEALVVVLDREGRIVRFNRACERTTGYLFAEVDGRPPWDFLLAPEEAEAVKGAFARLQIGQFPNEHQNLWLAKDGSRHLIAWSNTALPGKDGAVEYVIGTGVDITGHRQAEAERERLLAQVMVERGIAEELARTLERERDTLHTIMDNTRAHIAYFDTQFRFLRVNATYEQGCGHRQDELLGRCHSELFPNPEYQAVFERVRDTGQTVEFRARPFEFADQPERGITYWNGTLAPIKDAAGRVKGLVLSLEDVTEQVQAEQALRQSEEGLSQLFEILPIGISVVGRDRNVVKANPALSSILDLSEGDPLHDHYRQRRYVTADGRPFPADDFPSRRAFNEQRVIHDIEIGVEKEGGELIWTSVSAVPISFPGWRVVVVTTDITDRHKAEHELQGALELSHRRHAEISALLDGARQVLAEQSFEDTARAIFGACKDLIGATSGYVALSSQGGTHNEPLFLDTGGRPCAVELALPMPIRGLRGEVYRTGRVISDNNFSSSRWAQLLPEGHVGVENLLFAPLIIGGRVVGLLGLADKPGGFTTNDERLAEAFCELASIALQNSHLRASLEESELRFRSVVETASAAIVTTDSQGRVIFWNRMAETIFGYSAQEAIGARLTVIFPERLRPAHQAGMFGAVSKENMRLAGETVETIGARKSGSEFPLEISLTTWQTGEASFFTLLMHDITRRKHSEAALWEAKRSIEAVIEASPLAIVALDIDRNVRLWNSAAERIFGWSESEALGHPYPLVPESRQHEFQEFLAQSFAGQTLSGMETVRHRKDGSLVPVSIWTAPLYDAQRNISNVMVTLADISDSKRDEEALRRYAHEQTALNTVASAVAGTLDQEELLPVVLDAVLPAMEADVGWILLPGAGQGDPLHVVAARTMPERFLVNETTLPIRDCPIYQSCSPGAKAPVEPCLVEDCPALAQVCVNGHGLHHLICVPLWAGQRVLGVLKIGWRRPCADQKRNHGVLLSIGRQVGVALHNAQLYQQARQVNGLRTLSALDRALATTLELTELAEVTLDRVASDLDAPAASILLLPPAAQARPVMQVFTQAQGWQEVTAAGQESTYWQAILDRLEDRQEPVPIAVERPEAAGPDREPPQQGEASGLAVPFWGESDLVAVLVLAGRPATHPFSDEDRALAHVAASHVGQAMQNAQLYDAVRRLLQEQQQTRAQLIQSEKMAALGRLAATIAHEISNPLQSVQSCLTLVQEEMDGNRRRDKVDQFLAVADGEVGRISGIVRRMRDYYRPAHERLQPTDLEVVLDNVLDLSDKKLQHHRIRVERVDGGQLPLIQANPDHLRQVFLNLILNAIDAMPSGGLLRVRTGLGQIQLTGEPPQPAAYVEISDTGQGMTPEVQAHLFEPFFTTKVQGSGLGLSICYNIIAAYNGQITVASEAGVGTSLSILLPLTPA